MKRLQIAGFLVVIITGAVYLHADMIPLFSQADSAYTSVFAYNRLQTQQVSSESSIDFDASIRFIDLGETLPKAPEGADLSNQQQIEQLPAEHSSMVLFLSALGGLGAWQLGRSAKKFHFGAVPEWYHPGGVRQVGHSVAIDLEFDTMTVCLAIEQTGSEHPVWQYLERQERFYCESQYLHAPSTPRAPPLLS